MWIWLFFPLRRKYPIFCSSRVPFRNENADDATQVLMKKKKPDNAKTITEWKIENINGSHDKSMCTIANQLFVQKWSRSIQIAQ